MYSYDTTKMVAMEKYLQHTAASIPGAVYSSRDISTDATLPVFEKSSVTWKTFRGGVVVWSVEAWLHRDSEYLRGGWPWCLKPTTRPEPEPEP